MVRIHRSNEKEPNLEREFPDPPFTQSDYNKIDLEAKEIAKTEHPKFSVRERWIAKNGGGTLDPKYGLLVKPHEYRRLSDRWSKFTEWSAGKEFGEREKLKQLEASNFNI